MISNLWDDIELYCGCEHEEPQKMVLHQMGKQLYYVCPQNPTLENNKGASHSATCSNRLSIIDFEKMLDYLSELMTEANLSGAEFNLTHLKWKKKGIEYRILEHRKKIKILVLNKPECNK